MNSLFITPRMRQELRQRRLSLSLPCLPSPPGEAVLWLLPHRCTPAIEHRRIDRRIVDILRCTVRQRCPLSPEAPAPTLHRAALWFFLFSNGTLSCRSQDDDIWPADSTIVIRHITVFSCVIFYFEHIIKLLAKTYLVNSVVSQHCQEICNIKMSKYAGGGLLNLTQLFPSH